MVKKLLMLAFVLIFSVQLLAEDDTKKLGALDDKKAYARQEPDHESEHGDHDGSSGSWQPERGYYEEYPKKYHYLLYNRAKHHGPEAAGHGHANSGHDCHPKNEQIRAMNDVAAQAAKFVEKLPIFKDREASRAILPKEYYMPFYFDIPGLSFIWDAAGWHWIYWPGVSDSDFAKGDKPENVIYLQTKNGHQPVGIMFASGSKPGPEFGGCMTRWHLHDGGGEGLGYMLHIWTFGNPDGPYGPVKCGGISFRACVDKVRNPLANPKR